MPRLALLVLVWLGASSSLLAADTVPDGGERDARLEIRSHVVAAEHNWGGHHRFVLSVLGASRPDGFVPLLAIGLAPEGGRDQWLAVWNLGSESAGWTQHLRAFIPGYWATPGAAPAVLPDPPELGFPKPDLTARARTTGSQRRLARWTARLTARVLGLLQPARVALHSYTRFHNDLDDRRFHQLYTKVRLYEEVSRAHPSSDHLSMAGIHDLLYQLLINQHPLGVLHDDRPAVEVVAHFENDRRTHMGQVASHLQAQATLHHLRYDEVAYGLPGRPPVSYGALLSLRGADLPAPTPGWPARNPFDLAYNPYTHPEIRALAAASPGEAIPLAYYVLPSQFNLKAVLVADFFRPDNVTTRQLSGALRIGLEHLLAVADLSLVPRVAVGAGSYGMGRADVSLFSNRSTAAGVEAARVFGLIGGARPHGRDLDLDLEAALERRVANPLASAFWREALVAEAQYDSLRGSGSGALALALRRLHEDEARALLGLGNKAILEEDYRAYLEERAYQDARRTVQQFNRAQHLSPYDWDALLDAWHRLAARDPEHTGRDARQFVQRMDRLFPRAVPERHHPDVLRILARPESPPPEMRPRLVLIKVDGVSDLFLRAAIDPHGKEVQQLPAPDLFRQAHADLRAVLGRERLLPNLTWYFDEQGVRPEAVYSGTLALSAPSWTVIDTGQPSLVKDQFLFNRATGSVTALTNLIRETARLVRGGNRTSALWKLDLLGVRPIGDAFAPDRRWTSIQVVAREVPGEQISELARYVATGGTRSSNPARVAARHLRQAAGAPDIKAQSDRALADLAANVITRRDEAGGERYDLVNLIFPSLDAQFHVNADYANVLAWMVMLDEAVGTVFAAIEGSQRRDATLVALVSDHGLDFDPVAVNYAFPITSWFRTAGWGGHTTLSPAAENFAQDWRVPVRGLEFRPRTHESAASPYGARVPHGEDGYVTALLANEGNPRFDAYLRHSDLNRLHLLLLEVLRLRHDPDRLAHIYPVFAETLEDLRPWLSRDVDRLREQVAAFTGYRAHLLAQGDAAALDAADRLDEDLARARVIVVALDRVLAIPTDEAEWHRWAAAGFRVSHLVPKQYLGVRNDLTTLHGYVTGWSEPAETRWTSGPAAFSRISYPDLIPEFRAANANSYGNDVPFDLFAVSLPIEAAGAVDRPLRQAIWLRFSQGRGEAVLFEALDGSIRFMPIHPLMAQGGRLEVRADPAADPLGYGALNFGWHTPYEWARLAGHQQWGTLPVILTDVFRDNHRDFLVRPEYRQEIAETTGLDPDRHAAAVDHLFGQMTPDFRVWTHSGWNVNTRSHTPGGTHGGFTTVENRVVFAVWGGDRFDLPRGRTMPGTYLSQDITPTLLHLMGMLDAGGRVVLPDDLAETTRFAPFAGRVIPLSPAPDSVLAP